MQTPLQVSFRGMERSEAVEARIRELAAKLERFYDRITSCHVVVQAPHRSQAKAKHYEVHIQLRVPGEEIVVNRERAHEDAHHDVYIAVRDAFAAAERRLEDFVRRRSA